jgi:hypothetical protein
MSTEPDEVHFSYQDSGMPVTPALAHRFLKEAFQCRYDESYDDNNWTEEEAKSIIERINMIQHAIMVFDLDIYDIWLLFERDTNVGEVFDCNPPGFVIMMSTPLLKKQLFKQLHPNATYAGSATEHKLDNMDEIIDHSNGD